MPFNVSSVLVSAITMSNRSSIMYARIIFFFPKGEMFAGLDTTDYPYMEGSRSPPSAAVQI